MLDIGEVVLRLFQFSKCKLRLENTGTYVAVHGKTTDVLQRKVLVRPNLSHVKDVPLVLLGLFGAHQLDIDIAYGVFTLLDSLEHVANHKVRVLSGDPGSFLGGEVLDPLLRFDVDFGIFKRAILSMISADILASGNSRRLRV